MHRRRSTERSVVASGGGNRVSEITTNSSFLGMKERGIKNRSEVDEFKFFQFFFKFQLASCTMVQPAIAVDP